MKNYRKHLLDIKTFFFDCDGVLTDGSVLVTEKEQLRKMNVKDGYAIQYAIKKGYRVVILSGGKSDSVETRFKLLGITDIFMGVERKIEVFDKYTKLNKIRHREILYMGDDIPDYEPMIKCGVACCPSDAADEIKAISHYISPINGGYGCVRDVIEQVLRIQKTWFTDGAFLW